jgi:outer membrane lipoprotein carrier protein
MAVVKHVPVFFLAVTIAVSASAAITAEEAAANLEKALGALRTFQAKFEQLYYSVSVSDTLHESGEVLFQKPDLMRWEYKDPQKKVFLYKDGVIQMYLAEENQLTRSRVSKEAIESDILGIFLGHRSFHEIYVIEDTHFPTDTAHVRQIKLTPRTEGDYSHILLEIDEATWLLRRAVFLEWAGNKREFIFSRFRVNAGLPGRTFELKVPPDCEIIDDTGVIRR